MKPERMLTGLKVLGICTCAATLIMPLNLLISFIVEQVGREIQSFIFGGIVLTFLFVPFATAFLYLLFSALFHFSARRAVEMGVGMIVAALLETGAFYLWEWGVSKSVMFARILGLLFPVLMLALTVVLTGLAIAKKNIRLGWAAAAVLYSFWSGAGIYMACIDVWETILYLYNWIPFAGISAFIAADLIDTMRSVKKRES